MPIIKLERKDDEMIGSYTHDEDGWICIDKAKQLVNNIATIMNWYIEKT